MTFTTGLRVRHLRGSCSELEVEERGKGRGKVAYELAQKQGHRWGRPCYGRKTAEARSSRMGSTSNANN
eukprot:8737946-Alexandrium_andersonii.AAC.1